MAVDDTDLIPLDEAASVRRGRLFQLKVKKSHAARQDSLDTLRQRSDGQWQARIGGRLRGRTFVHPLRRVVEAEIHEHYNAALMEAVRCINKL